ncbi:molybdate ABC transporter substrate-binding protein [Phreatobacter sp.]|uniref:molybdate ABC transporter substrate-binding protein n=1 Tax=Phreatobacter sp. TaxID=1966341 RepID=UPI0025CBA1ED|nr:molybdate ABC transporter substrate-binding protein [Phreatobacter sp.]
MRTLIIAAVLALSTGSALAQETVLLHAAGSLRGALTEVSSAFVAAGGPKVTQVYRPSGLIREAIAGGERAEVFASANMTHPQALASAGKAGPVVLFARNALCAFVRPGIEVSPATLLDRMLDPAIKLGTSTPRADPAGDYAYQVFARAEAVRAGARAALEAKALQLTGGPTSAPVPAGRNAYGHVLAEGKADLFLAYCTNAGPIGREQPGIRMVHLPETLAVGADYGITVIASASPAAYRLALFVLSPPGQQILARHGFVAPGLPKE